METEGLMSEEERQAALKFERERAWELKKQEIEAVTDRLGFPIEPQIKDTVVGLNLLGLNTVQSCEGHPDRGMGAPWVEIAAPNQPDWWYVGQAEIFNKVAGKYGISTGAVLHADNEEAWQEAWQLTAQNTSSPTPEYQAWQEETRLLLEKSEALMTEFNQRRDASTDSRLFLDGDRVHNGGSDYALVKEMSEEQRIGLPERLAAYQSEINSFASFLKEKYQSEGGLGQENGGR